MVIGGGRADEVFVVGTGVTEGLLVPAVEGG